MLFFYPYVNMSPYSFRSRPRKTTRRYRKRNNRVLSKKSIYGSRSARAQSNQIAALNRKINYISRRDKPETKIVNSSVYNKRFTSKLLSDVYTVVVPALPTPSGTSDSGMVGDVCHMKSFKLNLYCEYYNTSDTGYHRTESAGGVVRIVAIQHKVVNNDGIDSINPSTILQEYGSSGDSYTAMAFSPFKTGITNKYRVLLDKRYYLTTDKNQLCLNLACPLGKYRDLRYTNNLPVNGWSNYVNFIIFVSGLHGDNDFSETIDCTYSTKLVYTDA